jgi:DNA anti-recombination protein RmuC
MSDLHTSDDATAQIDSIFEVATDPQPTEAAPPPADASAALEQVREILLGHQKREMEQRAVQAEQRMDFAIAEMKADIGRQSDELRSAIQGELAELKETLSAESDERSTQHDKLQAELQSGIDALEKRLTTLQEQLTAAQKELCESLQRKVDGVSQALETKIERIAGEMCAEAIRLRADCIDRATMSSLLSKLALDVSGEPAATTESPTKKPSR